MNIGKRIAIFDTSVIDGEKNTDSFFGGRDELEKFSAICEVVVPDLVIDEIKKHKKRHLTSTKSKFLSNPFRFMLGIEDEAVNALGIDEVIERLLTSEVISHTVIKLSKEDALERIRTMCHECVAPFGENEDKGFKDAYILLTIEEYLENIEDEQVFVVVKDGKLREAFEKLQKLTVIRDFDEFELFNKAQFIEPYFLERLSETIEEKVDEASVLNADFNINNNWVLEIDTDEKPTFIEIDFKNKEIIGFAKVRLPNGINNLVNSGSFDTTDEWVEKLSDYVQYFNNAELIELIKGSVSNNQIYWIAGKETLKQFFYPILEKVEHLLDERTKNRFIEKFEYERG